MNKQDLPAISIEDEFSRLQRVIVGLGSPYQRDKARVAEEMRQFPFVPDTARKAEVLALAYPTEAQLLSEYAGFVATLERHGVDVLLANPDAAYSFDYTCPRDIGFVIGDYFFIANMSVSSRVSEIETIRQHLQTLDAERIVRLPDGCVLEGGDVIVLDRATVLVGFNQRSNPAGYEFLKACLAAHGIDAIPVRHSQLHLDCCLNPLGMGHLLIHPESLAANDENTWRVLEEFSWIRIDHVEREHLASNVLSIDPTTIIARDHESCARVNSELANLGYSIEAVSFDGVPATGGSFRCASLALCRLDC